MNRTTGLQLIAYSLLLGGLTYLGHLAAPSFTRATLIGGVAGAVLCLIWGVRAMQGHPGKALPILTLIPISFVMLSQSVIAWGRGGHEGPGHPNAALLTTLLFALSLAMLVRIAYAGVVLVGQPADPGNAQR